MSQDGSPPKRPGRFGARLALPPTPVDGVAHDAVQAVFLDFEHRAQRRRAVLRLMLVGVMVLAIFAGTNRASWGPQFALVAVYGVIAIGAAFLHLRREPDARRLHAVLPMMVVDIAAISLLQLPSTGSYLMLGLLAFLPFFIATHLGQWAAIMSVTSRPVPT